MEKVQICNCLVHKATMDQTIHVIKEAILSKKPFQHVVVNASKIVQMQSNKELYESVNSCDLINADGMSIVWASKFLNTPLPERVAGIDIMERLVLQSKMDGFKIYFLGAKKKIVSKVVSTYEKRYGKTIIAGYKDGYFSSTEEPEVVKEISQSRADILFVAISSPQKELFLNRNKDLLNVPFIMGVGGSFDVVSGLSKRAPLWMQNGGLEWFYRFLQEPRRMWKRYLVGNTKFIWLLIKQRLGLYKNPFD